MKYQGIDPENVHTKVSELTKAFKEAHSVEEQNTILSSINQIKSYVYTQSILVAIRYSLNTNDAFYKNEQNRMDQLLPELEKSFSAFSRALVTSSFRDDLENEWGKQLFKLKDLELRSFSGDIVPELQIENQLTTAYSQLIASAKIAFQGNTYTLAQLAPFEQDINRTIREKALNARTDFMATHEAQFDQIFEDLVKIRTKIAQKLGYSTFIELGYARMSRCYSEKEVANFRKQVKDFIVPLASKLKDEQRRRIGVEKLLAHDQLFLFTDGNATPKGDTHWILEQSKELFSLLSPETGKFYRLMEENELLDVLSSEGKRNGGFCTIIPDEKIPFVFANFNGTASDIEDLVHEIGHAFQNYQSRNVRVPEYFIPTMEAGEIHSLSMELFTYPWLDLFFKEDTSKYKYSHLTKALTDLPYVAAVDEYQHIIYANPTLSSIERKQVWKQLEQTYMPYLQTAGNNYLERGNLWQRQLHIFVTPFYYIDYGLAQICALQFLKRMQVDQKSAWNDYMQLCQLGGSKSFMDLMETVGLTSPFKDGCVEEIIKDIEYLLKQPIT